MGSLRAELVQLAARFVLPGRVMSAMMAAWMSALLLTASGAIAR